MLVKQAPAVMLISETRQLMYTVYADEQMMREPFSIATTCLLEKRSLASFGMEADVFETVLN